MGLLKNEVESDGIALPARTDVKTHFPPTGHLEFHALHEIIAAPEVLGDLRAGRQAVTMLGHSASDADFSAFHGLTVGGFHMQSPAVYLVERQGFFIAAIGNTEQFLVGKDGKVVSRNVQMMNLEDEIKKLLK